MTLTLHLADRASRQRDPGLTAELRLNFTPGTGRFTVRDIRRRYRALRKLGLNASYARDMVWNLLFNSHLATRTDYWSKETE
jgi:hypothetical protein